VFVLFHWFLQAWDISTVEGYENADMYVKMIHPHSDKNSAVCCCNTRPIRAIGGRERVRSNWEGVDSCKVIEGLIYLPYVQCVMFDGMLDCAPLHYFDDSAMVPRHNIDQEDFFYRWTLDVKLLVSISVGHQV
jgi:hypothetical protein